MAVALDEKNNERCHWKIIKPNFNIHIPPFSQHNHFATSGQRQWLLSWKGRVEFWLRLKNLRSRFEYHLPCNLIESYRYLRPQLFWSAHQKIKRKTMLDWFRSFFFSLYGLHIWCNVVVKGIIIVRKSVRSTFVYKLYNTFEWYIVARIPRVTRGFSVLNSCVYQENKSDGWDIPWNTTTKGCITILYHPIGNTETSKASIIKV